MWTIPGHALPAPASALLASPNPHLCWGGKSNPARQTPAGPGTGRRQPHEATARMRLAGAKRLWRVWPAHPAFGHCAIRLWREPGGTFQPPSTSQPALPLGEELRSKAAGKGQDPCCSHSGTKQPNSPGSRGLRGTSTPSWPQPRASKKESLKKEVAAGYFLEESHLLCGGGGETKREGQIAVWCSGFLVKVHHLDPRAHEGSSPRVPV